MSTSLGLVMSRIRVEEKLLMKALEKRAITFERIDDGRVNFDLRTRRAPWDTVIDRSLSFGRALATMRILESQGVNCINSAKVIATCGDKIATQAVLERAGIRCPATRVAFTPQAALDAVEELGYPVVVKPTVGSWGRLVARLNDRHAAEAVLEDRATLGGWTHQVFYLQELIDKPGRDIRLFVVDGQAICAIYRYSDHWITNTARGASAANCPVDDGLRQIARDTAAAIGGVILSVDIVETRDGERLVLEVNHNTEFRNSIETTGVDIPGRIVDAIVAKREIALSC